MTKIYLNTIIRAWHANWDTKHKVKYSNILTLRNLDKFMQNIIDTYFRKCGDADQIRYLLASRDRDENNIVLGLILFNLLHYFPAANYELINNKLDISLATDSGLTKFDLSFRDNKLYLYLKLKSLTLFHIGKEYDPIVFEEIKKILTSLGFINEAEKYYSDEIKCYIYTWS
jgi:hypothetical protein